MEQSTDRDILQGHYTDIQQELQVKTDTLKAQRQKVRALEREVSDLQSEFQSDRADYLETIRRLEKNLKFWQQLMDKALPMLRRDGRFWDPDAIRSDSEYNDDLGRWKLPDNALARVKLPPAGKKFHNFHHYHHPSSSPLRYNYQHERWFYYHHIHSMCHLFKSMHPIHQLLDRNKVFEVDTMRKAHQRH